SRTREGRPGGAPLDTAGGLWPGLLDLDARAGLLELGLELVGLVALDALLDGLGRLVDERLGLLEAQARDGADDLDHLDLLVACGGDDDVDGARLLLGGRAVSGAAAGGRGGGDSGRRDAELLLERLDALRQLQHGDALELVDPFSSGGGHGYSESSGVSVFSVVVSAACGSSAGASSVAVSAGASSVASSSAGASAAGAFASAAGASASAAGASASAAGASASAPGASASAAGASAAAAASTAA